MTTRILVPGETCWGVESVGQVGVLVDAHSYYSMLYACFARAERYILLSGWQFDSKVALLRGEEATGAAYDPRLLHMLNQLCAERPELRVYILAWDFSVVYALEREWLQKLAFEWMTHENVRFVFDPCVPLWGSHHQKFVVVDGAVGFCGGADVCEHRWDDRDHRAVNMNRSQADGTVYGPYHEVHTYFIGRAVDRLVEFFIARWKCAGGPALQLNARGTPFVLPAARAVPLRTTEMAFSRTLADPEPHLEVRELMVRAILAAERLIYIETQYLSARAVGEALTRRMRARGRSRLEVVIVLPAEPEAPKEALAIGVPQARIVQHLRHVAHEHGHALGVYTTGPEPGVYTYVHSKLLSVDDRFLTIGSANMTNRSMGVDTELNVAWETEDPSSPLGRSIRRLRTELLAEHAGLLDPATRTPPGSLVDLLGLARIPGLVQRLEALAARPDARLHVHVPRDPAVDDVLIDAVHTSVGMYLDPERPVSPEDLEQPEHWRDLFSRGIGRLKERLGLV